MDCPASPTPEEVMTWRELQRAFFAAVGALSVSEQLVIEYPTVGYRYAEVAQVHGMTLAAVRKQTQRAREKLRARLVCFDKD